MQQQWTISWWHCDIWWKVNFIWKLVTTSSVAGLRRSSKALPKAKRAPKKKVMVTVWWSAVGLIYYSFMNPSKTITSEKSAQQVDEIYQKLQCLQLALVNRKGPVLLHNNVWLHITQPTFQKLYELGYKVLPYPPHSADLSTNRVPLQASPQLFAGKMLPQPVGSRKCFLRVHRTLKHGCLYYGNRQTSVLLAMRVDCNGSYFD